MISLNQVIWIDQDLVILDQTACLILEDLVPLSQIFLACPRFVRGRGVVGICGVIFHFILS